MGLGRHPWRSLHQSCRRKKLPVTTQVLQVLVWGLWVRGLVRVFQSLEHASKPRIIMSVETIWGHSRLCHLCGHRWVLGELAQGWLACKKGLLQQTQPVDRSTMSLTGGGSTAPMCHSSRSLYEVEVCSKLFRAFDVQDVHLLGEWGGGENGRMGVLHQPTFFFPYCDWSFTGGASLGCD